MLARRDTRLEAARLRRLSPLQTVEDQSQTWGIRCHSCTEREGLPPSWKLRYKTYVLRFTRESKFSFNQRIAQSLPSYSRALHESHRRRHPAHIRPGCDRRFHAHSPTVLGGYKCRTHPCKYRCPAQSSL